MANNNSKKNNIISVIVFLILTLTIAVFCITIFRMKDTPENNDKKSDTTADIEMISDENESEETSEDISDDNKEELTENHSDEEISEAEWSEISEMETCLLLDRKQNHFITSLKKLLESDDIAESFSFELHAEDTENLGEIKYGIGISVKNNCPYATDQNWYNFTDQIFFTEDSSAAVEIIIPDELKEYIDPSGRILFGYWWGDAEKVVIDKIICHRTKAGMERPDNTSENADLYIIE